MAMSAGEKLCVAAGVLVAATAGAVVAERRAVRRIHDRAAPDLDPLYALPDDVTHHHLESYDGANLHVVERGRGRPLLLVHGITLRAGVWAPQLHLMADRYRVVAVDVRAHGESTVGAEGMGRVRAARDVVAVMEALDLRDAIVVGHSMGGMILMQFCADHPEVLAERVSGLVFMDTAAYQVLPPVVGRAAKALGHRGVTRVEAGGRMPQARPDSDLTLLTTRLAFGAAPPAAAVEQVSRYVEEFAPNVSVPSWVDLLDHDGRAALAATSTPSMVLVGSRDLLTPVYQARRIAQFLPHAELHVLPRAGHQLMQERPHEVAALIDAFAAKVDRSGGSSNGRAAAGHNGSGSSGRPTPAAP